MATLSLPSPPKDAKLKSPLHNRILVAKAENVGARAAIKSPDRHSASGDMIEASAPDLISAGPTFQANRGSGARDDVVCLIAEDVERVIADVNSAAGVGTPIGHIRDGDEESLPLDPCADAGLTLDLVDIVRVGIFGGFVIRRGEEAQGPRPVIDGKATGVRPATDRIDDRIPDRACRSHGGDCPRVLAQKHRRGVTATVAGDEERVRSYLDSVVFHLAVKGTGWSDPILQLSILSRMAWKNSPYGSRFSPVPSREWRS